LGSDASDAENLYRFKREFRSLADVQHRNLMRLGELGGDAASPPFVEPVEVLPHHW